MMKKSNYYISVSEPWDFEGPDGKNIIKGNVLKVIDLNCVLFESNSIIEIDGYSGTNFVLFSRYYDSNFASLNDEKFWVINGGILLKNLNETLDKKELEQNSKFVIIGTLKK